MTLSSLDEATANLQYLRVRGKASMRQLLELVLLEGAEYNWTVGEQVDAILAELAEPSDVMAAQGQWAQVSERAPVIDCVNAGLKAREIFKAMIRAI